MTATEERPAVGGFERVPPQDLDAEQCVLGGMLLSQDAIGDASEIVKGADFYRPAHETIFAAILALYGKGEPADPITVAAELTKRGEIARIGGSPYLHTLVNAVPTAANAGHYAEIVHERAVLRRLVEAGTRITQMGYAAEGDLDEIVNTAQAEVYAVTEQRSAGEPGSKLSVITARVIDQAGTRREDEMTGVPTGFTDLDSLTRGLQPGQFIVVAGRPAMGKSTLAIDFARAAAIDHGRSVAVFSLEMSEDEIGMRVISAQARVGLHHLRSGALTDDDWRRIARTVPDIEEARMHIDDSPGLSLPDIRTRCRRLAARDSLDLVIVDYLQLVTPASTRRNSSRQEDVSDISRSLKLLAKELKAPVIGLSQLNRGPEQRQDRKPQVSDLRESGAIENDADMVILLHREDAYEKDSPRAGEADLIVGKHRNGPTATITVAFQGHYSRFVDMAAT
ncbi:putative replicative DNA helicase (plasmid) [Actinacidiphila reveromycinica]|uniref:Replicative DNA helicase n=1 Tax=Actinacidiphila reveromycinica TaxID=659352 RepID=A0A7R6QEA3_9ACTN|nr:replicative DNA helicase [Streptomyces sp. SN-593]BBG20676.1 putative replicative DNA helicase [Streptomyces sp. SN-593]